MMFVRGGDGLIRGKAETAKTVHDDVKDGGDAILRGEAE
jgi:hypothetical protein